MTALHHWLDAAPEPPQNQRADPPKRQRSAEGPRVIDAADDERRGVRNVPEQERQHPSLEDRRLALGDEQDVAPPGQKKPHDDRDAVCGVERAGRPGSGDERRGRDRFDRPAQALTVCRLRDEEQSQEHDGNRRSDPVHGGLGLKQTNLDRFGVSLPA